MVMGHDRIKMSTSIIDYLFRELAISDLGRSELGHVSEEDLRHDTLHRSPEPEVLEEQEVVVRSTLADPAEFAGPGPSIDVDAWPGEPGAEVPRVVVRRSRADGLVRDVRIQAVIDAKARGYEGDACDECGAMTMVRNGSCLKCVSCGSTSGCS
jgi:ribonucleoside-diphosphate reductase alpha chain